MRAKRFRALGDCFCLFLGVGVKRMTKRPKEPRKPLSAVSSCHSLSMLVFLKFKKSDIATRICQSETSWLASFGSPAAL